MTVLVTGRSGTGKLSALAALGRRGFEVVDTDEGGWSEWSDEDGGYVWRGPDRRAARPKWNVPLFVSGTVSNQGRFYGDLLAAVVLLSARRTFCSVASTSGPRTRTGREPTSAS
jgi:hypothetical protein